MSAPARTVQSVDSCVASYTARCPSGPLASVRYAWCRSVSIRAVTVTVRTGPGQVNRTSVTCAGIVISESGSDVGQIAEYVARTPDDFTVLAGSATTLFHSFCAGCAGAVLAIAALLPEECVRMQTLVFDGRLEEAREIQRRIMPLARSVGGTYGVPGLKAALDLIGLAGGAPRPPLRPVPPQTQEIIRGQLEALGLGLARE